MQLHSLFREELNGHWLLLIIISLLLGSGCKKNRLKDDKAILVGEWEWIYTDKDNFGTLPAYELVTPANQGNTYQLLFKKKGVVHLMKNGDCQERKRTVFSSWDHLSNGEISFHILLNNDLDDQLFGFVRSSDTLVIMDRWPYKEAEACSSGCNFTHYFVKR